MCMGQSLTCFSVPKKKVWPCESETSWHLYSSRLHLPTHWLISCTIPLVKDTVVQLLPNWMSFPFSGKGNVSTIVH